MNYSKITLDKSLKIWYKVNQNKEAIWKKMK
jgi:hypothetical protein